MTGRRLLSKIHNSQNVGLILVVSDPILAQSQQTTVKQSHSTCIKMKCHHTPWIWLQRFGGVERRASKCVTRKCCWY